MMITAHGYPILWCPHTPFALFSKEYSQTARPVLLRPNFRECVGRRSKTENLIRRSLRSDSQPPSNSLAATLHATQTVLPRDALQSINEQHSCAETKTQSHAARASNCNKHRRLTATVKTSLMRVLWLAFQRRCPFFKMKMIQIVSFRYWKKRKRARNRSEMTHAVPTTSPVATPWRVFQELCLTFRMTESFP
uniref:Uncharacterized protein n=1 Tax=Parascaris univalens TaxID=6257 RepID=A0A915A7A4_PARUN